MTVLLGFLVYDWIILYMQKQICCYGNNFYDIMVKKPKRRSCLHDKNYECLRIAGAALQRNNSWISLVNNPRETEDIL